MYFYSNHQDILINFVKKKVMQDEGVIIYVHKTDAERGGGGWANADITDKGRRGGWGNADNG